MFQFVLFAAIAVITIVVLFSGFRISLSSLEESNPYERLNISSLEMSLLMQQASLLESATSEKPATDISIPLITTEDFLSRRKIVASVS